MLPTFAADPRVALVAAADPRAEARARFAADFSAQDLRDRRGALRRSGGRDRLCGDAASASRAARDPGGAARQACAGREADGADARRMRRDDRRGAARRACISSSATAIRSTRRSCARAQLIAGGAFGAVRMIHALNYTDFIRRPRRPEELDTAQGGGAVFNQAAHQVDIVRLLGGGRVTSVRAATGAWDAARPTEGAYSALLTFEDGAFASLTYGGYGHFDSDEFQGWIGEMGQAKTPYARKPQRFRQRRGRGRLQERPQLRRRGLSAGRRRTTLAHQHFGTDHRELRARRPAPAAERRDDLSERRRAARSAAAAVRPARRSDRRALRCGRPRQAAAARRRMGDGDAGGLPRDPAVRRARAATSRSRIRSRR